MACELKRPQIDSKPAFWRTQLPQPAVLASPSFPAMGAEWYSDRVEQSHIRFGSLYNRTRVPNASDIESIDPCPVVASADWRHPARGHRCRPCAGQRQIECFRSLNVHFRDGPTIGLPNLVCLALV